MSLQHPQSEVAPALEPGPHVEYLARRETHSARSIAAVVVAALIVLGCLYLLTETILSLDGDDPLLAKPGTMGEAVTQFAARAHSLPTAAVIAVGVIIASCGLVLIAKSVLPGSLRRHQLRDQRMAFIVDDAVLAANASRSLRRANGLSSTQVTSSISKRHLSAQITPTSGRPLRKEVVDEQLRELANRWDAKPGFHVHAEIDAEGVIAK